MDFITLFKKVVSLCPYSNWPTEKKLTTKFYEREEGILNLPVWEASCMMEP
jgi:hypothetical protein